MNNNSTSVTDSTIEESQIQLQHQLRFERSASHVSRGLCLVDVFLKNDGFIAASFPFLCLTNLGLSVSPAPGWLKDEPTMVRKMLRFSPAHFSHSTLAVGGLAHCCTVTLRYKHSFGGCLEFEPGSEYLLANFPNLNLTCTVGAGNYPSKRTLLQVPATMLRNIVRESVALADQMEIDRTFDDNTEPALR
jgi:hypothetical protein